MQVWIGRRVAPAPSSPAWDAMVDSPRPWQQGGSPTADGPSNVACRIVPAHTAAPVGASDLQSSSLSRREHAPSLCRRVDSLNKSSQMLCLCFDFVAILATWR